MTRPRPLCASLLLSFVLAACAGRTPQATVKSFYKAIEEGKTDSALELLSSQVFKAVDRSKVRAGLQAQTRAVLAKGGIKNLEIAKANVVGDVATLTANITYGDGSEESTNIELGKEDGQWRIQPGDRK